VIQLLRYMRGLLFVVPMVVANLQLRHLTTGRTLHNVGALLFDCDGTIAETERDITLKQFNEAFKASPETDLCNVEWSPALYGQLLSAGASQARFAKFFKDNPHLWPEECRGDAIKQAAFCDTMKRRKDDAFKLVWEREGVSALPGVMQLVETAHRHDIPIAVCSNSNTAPVTEICRTLFSSEVFTKLRFFCGDAFPKKPLPQMYLAAASSLGKDIATCLVFEDSEVGCRAGVTAGARVVACPSYYYGQNEDFEGAALLVKSLEELVLEVI